MYQTIQNLIFGFYINQMFVLILKPLGTFYTDLNIKALSLFQIIQNLIFVFLHLYQTLVLILKLLGTFGNLQISVNFSDVDLNIKEPYTLILVSHIKYFLLKIFHGCDIFQISTISNYSESNVCTYFTAWFS